MRTSAYTIFVDLPEERDAVLLVHGYTGAWDRVSRRVAGALRRREDGRTPRPLHGSWSDEAPAGAPAAGDSDGGLTPQEEARLAARGYLTRLDRDAEEELLVRVAGRLHERSLAAPPAYIFMPTYDCNLRCSYCYQDSMRTDPCQAHLLRAMKPPMVDRIFDAIPGFEEAAGVDPARRRRIGLFGGEPLLAAQRPTVERILERAGRLGEVTCWAVTNGTELAAYADLLGPDAAGGVGIGELQVTLDGSPDEHDRRRIYADGSGSFEVIAANIDLALERRAAVAVRLNVDRRNLDDLPRLAREIEARGWAGRPGFGVYAAPIRPGNGKTDHATILSSWALDRELRRLVDEEPAVAVIGRPDDGLRSRARRLLDGEELAPNLKPSFCSAHDRMYIFDPFGDIYACWERTGAPGSRVGRVTPEARIELAGAQLERWRGRTVAASPACRRCRYALHCGGGCAILALTEGGDFNGNYCDGFQARFRSSLAAAYLAHQAGAAPAAAANRVCDQ